MTVNGKLSDGDVVCKMVDGDDVSTLVAEAKLYTTTLIKAQEYVVPPFILFASGTMSSDRNPYACMLTRYCGTPMTGYWVENPVAIRYVIAVARDS